MITSIDMDMSTKSKSTIGGTPFKFLIEGLYAKHSFLSSASRLVVPKRSKTFDLHLNSMMNWNRIGRFNVRLIIYSCKAFY